jgi:hypothetical protein
MLRELRSCATLRRELRIVNQSDAQWASDRNPEFPPKLRKMRILSWACTIGSSIMFNMNVFEQRTADSDGPRGGQQSSLRVSDDASGAKHRHDTAVGLG